MTTHRFSRRTLLRGLGVSMALPWFESLNVWGDEPVGNQQASEAPVRLAVLFAGNGFHSKEWWAKGEGKDMELGQVLAPLADFRQKMLVIRGLYNDEAQKGNIHSSQTGNLLSGAPLASGGEIRSGTSIDQLLAQSHGRSTKVSEPCAGMREVEPVGPQELFHALQLAHLVEFADDAHAAGAVSGAGLRSALQRRSSAWRRERTRRRAVGRPRPAPSDQHHRSAEARRIPRLRA